MDDDWGYPHDFGNLHILSISSVNLCDIQLSSPQMLLFLSFSQSFIQFIIRSYLGFSIINQPASLGYPTSRKAPYSGHSHFSPDPVLWISRSHRTLPSYQHTTQLKDSGVASREINSWDQEKFCHWDDYQLNHTNSSTGWLGSWSLPQCITGTERFLESSHLWEKDATGMILQCPVLQWKRESTDPCWAMEIMNL